MAVVVQLSLMTSAFVLSREVKAESDRLLRASEATVRSQALLQQLGVTSRRFMVELERDAPNRRYLSLLRAQLGETRNHLNVEIGYFRAQIATGALTVRTVADPNGPDIRTAAAEIDPMLTSFLDRIDQIADFPLKDLTNTPQTWSSLDVAVAPQGRIVATLMQIGEALTRASNRQAERLYELNAVLNGLSVLMLATIAVVLVFPILSRQRRAIHVEMRLSERIDHYARQLEQSNTELRHSADVARELYVRCQAAERVKQSFLSAITDRLHTPLETILHASDALPRVVPGPGGDPGPTERIRSAGHALNDMLEDIIDIAQADPGTLTLRVSLVPVSSIFVDAMAEVRPLAERRGIVITTDVAQGSYVSIWCDRIRMTRLVVKILTNAAEHAPSGSEIVIGRERLEDRGLELWVRDQGPGLPQTYVEGIAAPLYQFDAGNTGAQSGPSAGIGIGLAVAKLNAEAHGGRIGAQNNGDGGCTVTLTLPPERVFSGEMSIPLSDGPALVHGRARI